MADIDAKDMGLAIKDIVLGVGAVAAGAAGGPAAASGVQVAGGALDRILGMAGVEPTRAQQFDRADFSARPRASGAGSPAALTTARPAPSQQTIAPASSEQQGEARTAVEHLRALGWPEDAVQRILSGPERGVVQRTAAGVSGQVEEHERWQQTLALYAEQSKQRSKANGGLG